MTREAYERFTLRAAGLTCALVILATLALSLAAQSVDDTQLKQVIIFGRHSVRAPVAPNTYLNGYSVQIFPDFGVAAGILTPNGEQLETILGGYYRQWLTQEGLLTGNDSADANFVFFHANAIQRTVDTAQHLWAGLLPGAPINVQYLTPSTAIDPLFDPVDAGVAQLDSQMAIAAVNGRLGGNAQSLASAYAQEMALARSILLGYPASQTPPPTAPANVTDVTDFNANPIIVTTGTQPARVDLGGLSTVENVIDPFVMEYADGLPVGWGQLTAAGVSQMLRITNLILDLEFRTPYLARVQSSNVASHIVRAMVQSATGNVMTGTLGTPSTKIVVLIASDVNVCGFAGLLHLDWLVPGYQPDFCSPGGAVVFELRQSQSTGEYIVRASYVTQTLDQLRNQTVLTLAAPPAIAPVFIPGCSFGNATFDCPLTKFVEVEKKAIDPLAVDLVNE
jgi:4-phytase / acid phosphatase